MDESPGDEHLAFMQWAVSNGVKIKGIAPARFPGRRLGMIATRAIQENEIMLTVPVALMLTIDSVPAGFVRQFPEGTSIHGILASFLTLGDSELLKGLDVWRSVWPSWEEFENSMPLFWSGQSGSAGRQSEKESENQRQSEIVSGAGFLPPSISGHWNSFSKDPVNVEYETRYQNLLPQQEKRLRSAWAHVVSVFPETDWKTFAYNWSIINSRSFYYVSPGKEEPEDWNDAIAMVPFADYFNHADDAACDVRFDGKKYTFKATRRYEKGEEIYMSYGSHSNDFLLVEYGFCLENNPSDTIYLDDIIFQELTIEEKEELAEHECFGNYEITSSGPDTNTAAAACLKYMSREDWRAYVAGTSQRGYDAKRTAAVVRVWIEMYLQETLVTMDKILDALKTSVGDRVQSGKAKKDRLELVLSRWRQIQTLCESALKVTGD